MISAQEKQDLGVPENLTQGRVLVLVSKYIGENSTEGIEAVNNATSTPTLQRIYPNFPLESGYYPLGEAIIKERPEAVVAILNHPDVSGLEVGQPAHVGREYTAVSLAITRMTPPRGFRAAKDMVDRLLDHPKIHINDCTPGTKTTALMQAAMLSSTYYLRQFLKRAEINVNARSRFGESALDLAFRLYQLKHAKHLLRDPRVELDPYEDIPPHELHEYASPIMNAVVYCRPRLVRMILAAGGNPDSLCRHRAGPTTTPFQLNFILLERANEECAFEARMEIARALWEAGATAMVPELYIRYVTLRGPSREALRNILKFTVFYICQQIPGTTLPAPYPARFAMFKALRVQFPKKSVRYYVERTARNSQVPPVSGLFLKHENQDLEDHESDTDDESWA